MFENVENIRQNHEFHHKCYGRQEDGIDSKGSKPSSGKNLKRHLLESYALASAIR